MLEMLGLRPQSKCGRDEEGIPQQCTHDGRNLNVLDVGGTRSRCFVLDLEDLR